MTDRTADEVIAAVAQEIRGAKGHFTHGVVGIAIEQLNKWADRLASVDLVSRQPQEPEKPPSTLSGQCGCDGPTRIDPNCKWHGSAADGRQPEQEQALIATMRNMAASWILADEDDNELKARQLRDIADQFAALTGSPDQTAPPRQERE